MGKIEEPGVLQRHEQHEHVAVIALAADLVRVDARGLVAVVAVGDQQLGVGQRALEGGDVVGVGDPPEARSSCPRRRSRPRTAPRSVTCASVSRAPPLVSGNRLKMGDRFARVARVSLSRSSLGPGMRALVRPDSPGAVVLHAHAREEPGAPAGAAVGARCSPGGAPTWPARPPGRGLPGAPVRERLGGAAHSSLAGRARRRCARCGPRARPAWRCRSRRREARSGCPAALRPRCHSGAS